VKEAVNANGGSIASRGDSVSQVQWVDVNLLMIGDPFGDRHRKLCSAAKPTVGWRDLSDPHAASGQVRLTIILAKSVCDSSHAIGLWSFGGELLGIADFDDTAKLIDHRTGTTKGRPSIQQPKMQS